MYYVVVRSKVKIEESAFLMLIYRFVIVVGQLFRHILPEGRPCQLHREVSSGLSPWGGIVFFLSSFDWQMTSLS